MASFVKKIKDYLGENSGADVAKRVALGAATGGVSETVKAAQGDRAATAVVTMGASEVKNAMSGSADTANKQKKEQEEVVDKAAKGTEVAYDKAAKILTQGKKNLANKEQDIIGGRSFQEALDDQYSETVSREDVRDVEPGEVAQQGDVEKIDLKTIPQARDIALAKLKSQQDALKSIQTPGVEASKATTATGLGTLSDIATGAQKAPSMAEALLRKQSEDLLKQQQASAASQPYNPAMARALMEKGAESQQKLGTDVAILRAQEEQKAIENKLTAAQNVASLGITNTKSLADMNQQDMQNTIDAMDNDSKNTIATQAQQLQATGMDQEAALKVAVANQTSDLESKRLAASIDTTNTENKLKADLANQGIDFNVLVNNAARGDAMAIENLGKNMQLYGMEKQDLYNQMGAIIGKEAAKNNFELAKLNLPADQTWVDIAKQFMGPAATAGGAVMSYMGSKNSSNTTPAK